MMRLLSLDRAACILCADKSMTVRLVPVSVPRTGWTTICEECLELFSQQNLAYACSRCGKSWVLPNTKKYPLATHCWDCEVQTDKPAGRERKPGQLERVDSADVRYGGRTARRVTRRLRDRPQEDQNTQSGDLPDWVRYRRMKAYRQGSVLYWQYQIAEEGAPQGGLRHDEDVTDWSEQDIYELTLRMFDMTGRELKKAGYELVEQLVADYSEQL